MSGMPWIRFFPSDWLAGSRGMSAAETGVYISLIAMMYERGEPLVEDVGRLARLCGASNSQFAKALDTLITEGKIVRVEGGLWNHRVGKEQVYRSEKSEVGKQAAEKRWKKTKQNQRSDDANAMPAQCEGNANQKPEPDIRNNPSTPKGVSPPTRRGTRVDGFHPDETVGIEIGLSPQQAHSEAEKFRDYFLGAPGQKGVKQDWPATWRNWARRAFENLPKHNQRGQHVQHRPSAVRPTLRDQIREGVRRANAGEGVSEPHGQDRQSDRPAWAADEHPGGMGSRQFSFERGEDGSFSDREEYPRRFAGARH